MLLALRGLVRSIVDGIVMLARRLLNLVPLTRAFGVRPTVTASAAAPPLVTASWLHEHYARVKVVDASWYLPAMKRDGRAEFSSRRLPGARFFDIDATDDASGLPHMLPSARFFASAMSECVGPSGEGGDVDMVAPSSPAAVLARRRLPPGGGRKDPSGRAREKTRF